MKKTELLTILENFKPKTKIFNNLSKTEFLDTILENSDMPTLLDMQKEEQKGGIVSLGLKEDDSDDEEVEVEKPAIPEKKEPKTDYKLRFATDIGIKAIIFDENFMKIDEQGKTAISDMFTDEEIEKIQKTNSSGWQKVERDNIWCKESHLDTGKSFKTIRCFNPRINTFGNNPYRYITTLYKRLDDQKDKQIEKIKDPINKNKLVNYVPMGPANENEEIAILPLSNYKTAILLSLPTKEEPYLFKMSPKVINFFYIK